MYNVLIVVCSYNGYIFERSVAKVKGMFNHASCGGVDSRKTRGTCTNRRLSQLLSVLCLMSKV
ncbi:hypothetical protein HanIR_Chr05g0249141 [Helianthus annuus]|nr:hypothetical protein HanIR_Chr05g0249141 [Helianthus annuus]